jgi:hypothetical protein
MNFYYKLKAFILLHAEDKWHGRRILFMGEWVTVPSEK